MEDEHNVSVLPALLSLAVLYLPLSFDSYAFPFTHPIFKDQYM